MELHFFQKTLTAASASKCSITSFRSSLFTSLLVVLLLYIPSNEQYVYAVFSDENSISSPRNHQKKILWESESIESIERKLWKVEEDIIFISEASSS